MEYSTLDPVAGRRAEVEGNDLTVPAGLARSSGVPGRVAENSSGWTAEDDGIPRHPSPSESACQAGDLKARSVCGIRIFSQGSSPVYVDPGLQGNRQGIWFVGEVMILGCQASREPSRKDPHGIGEAAGFEARLCSGVLAGERHWESLQEERRIDAESGDSNVGGVLLAPRVGDVEGDDDGHLGGEVDPGTNS